jgi:ketosteroid isomerase-like protein
MMPADHLVARTMTRRLALATMLVGLSGLQGTLVAAEPDTTSRAALHAALRDFSRAFAAADAAVLDTLLAADYLHTNGASGSTLTKAQWLDYIRSRSADLAAGRLELVRYETDEVVIRWHAETALVSSRVVAEGRQNGTAFTTRLRVTQVWVRSTGRWRRAAFHDSPIPPAGMK